jgi:hypothetical protein
MYVYAYVAIGQNGKLLHDTGIKFALPDVYGLAPEFPNYSLVGHWSSKLHGYDNLSPIQKICSEWFIKTHMF